MASLYQYKVRLGVVLIRDGRLLLVRQNNRPFWVFPGGTLELDEGMEECAIREIKEEIDLDIRIQKVLYLADFIQMPDTETPNAPICHTIDVFMLGEYISGEPTMTLDENLNDLGFFTFEEFQAMSVMPELASRRVLQDWPAAFSNANGVYLGKYGVD